MLQPNGRTKLYNVYACMYMETRSANTCNITPPSQAMYTPHTHNISVVTVAGICNSVGGGVLFDIPPRCRWRWRVQYAPCIVGQSSVPFPSPHTSSQGTRQPPPPLLIIRSTTRRDRHGSWLRDRGDDGLVQQHASQLIALAVLCTKYVSATPL